MMLKLIVISPIILLSSLMLAWYLYDRYQRQKNIVLLSKLSVSNIIDQQQNSKKHSNEEFKLKLIQAGGYR